MSEHNARKDFGVLFWLHLFAIAVIYSLPFWLNWKVITLFVMLYFLQLLVFGGCILTILEFRDRNKDSEQRIPGFHEYYLAKLGVKISRRKLEFVLNVVIPTLLVLAALLWQTLLLQEVLL